MGTIVRAHCITPPVLATLFYAGPCLPILANAAFFPAAGPFIFLLLAAPPFSGLRERNFD
jgi:hypothetical protein